ncbi:hypothetical protein NM688_g5961 [Phlebia brevispora]|uniref:Uncharacterized protein n=1 Tax=Phlebia brevispora TaxID=194682 RepID=A0ACC1SM54_9APHY|nr:hypothetical protein NM688_g5961 [Phlebia brevispora]
MMEPSEHCRSSFSRLANFDILTYILKRVPQRKDVLSFMYTCTIAYAAGIPILLGFPCHIDLVNMRIFHTFLVSRAPASFLALRDISFSNSLSEKLQRFEIEIVKDILRKATNLRALGLYRDILGQADEIPRLVASLTALRSFTVSDNPDENIAFVLSHLRAPLKRVHVSFFKEREVLSLLAEFWNTLESVAVTAAGFASTTSCYHNLTSLTISYYSQIRLSVLVPAMPNLQRLDVGCLNPHASAREGELVRQENFLFQQARTSPVWNLAFLSADAPALSILGLQFKVPCVEITRLGSLIWRDAAWWRRTMAPLRPTQLILSGEFPFEPGGLSRILCEGMQDLKYLQLNATFLLDGLRHRSSLVGTIVQYPDMRSKWLYVLQELMINDLAPLAEFTHGISNLSFNFNMERDLGRLPLIFRLATRHFLETTDTRPFARQAVEVVPSIEAVNFRIKVFDTVRQEHWLSDGKGGVIEDSTRYYTGVKELEDKCGLMNPDCKSQSTVAVL